mgnify:FL=1|tara:strand:+ start:2392 stop:3753 length:1362 start_codon:yes stop_codon:yes gene_type:complete
MKIIIAGTGEVGFHLSKLLAQESHDIVIIDTSKIALERATKNLDVSTIRGDATSIKTLESAGVSKADLLIAVTSTQHINILSCVIGKNLGVKRCIARISNSELLHRKETFDLKDIGINQVIYPESLGASEIKKLLKESAVSDSFVFDKGKLQLIGIKIDEKSELKDKTLAETTYLNPKTSFTPVAIVRDIEDIIENETIIPRSHNILKKDDVAYFIADSESGVDEVLSLSGRQHLDINDIMIYGGSDLAFISAKHLSKKYNVKLICEDLNKCEKFADALPNVMVLNGPATDIDFLREEDLDSMDAFLALSNETEKNILASLAAKESGVKKTISQVENIDFIPLAQNMGLNTTINIKYLTANFIVKYIREGELLNFTKLQGVDAEVIELEVKEDSPILENKLKDLNFPKEGIVGGLIRGEDSMIPRGDFEFKVGDRVLIVTKKEGMKAIEQMFK